MERDERTLLDQRHKAVEAQTQQTLATMASGMFASIVLLVGAFMWAYRGERTRRRLDQQRTNHEQARLREMELLLKLGGRARSP